MPQLQPHMRHQFKNAQHKRMHDGSVNASTLGVWRAHLRPGVGVWHTHSHGRTQTYRDAGKEARGERREARVHRRRGRQRLERETGMHPCHRRHRHMLAIQCQKQRQEGEERPRC
jgi:hypothetical protein